MQELTDGLSHWLVFYRTKSGALYNMTVDAETKEEAMDACMVYSRRFKSFETMPDGTPIIKKKVYMHEMWRS